MAYAILRKEDLNPQIFLMEIHAPAVTKKAEPGQFIILRIDEYGERLPFTIADFDREKGSVTIIVQAVGKTTKDLSKLEAGDTVLDFAGPLGMPTPLENLKKVAVFGGGNVAMDAARSAKRLGAENVYIIYRRGKEELPTRAEEVAHAEEEGVEFLLLQNPTKFIGGLDGWLTGVEVVDMQLGEPDASGRRRPQAVEGSEHIIEIDTAVVSIGQTPNPLIKKTTKGLDTNTRGCIIADEQGAASKPFVYAGGDVVTGAATVILAMGAGKTAALAIHDKLQNKEIDHD